MEERTLEDTNQENDDRKPAKRLNATVRWQDLVQPHVHQDQRGVLFQTLPYPYGVIHNLLDASFLKTVIREIKDNSTVDFKESDLFKVYQSIDLANLQQQSHQETMPITMRLRNLLYSQDWRHTMEDWNGLPRGTLLDKVDCACNCHMTGCHLLCHDDVIGTRKISYILYLTDDNWEANEGGALELYGSSDGGPQTNPSSFLLPTFNSLAFFVVKPGVSFHAVQEVLGDRPRLSLQGWYHAAEPPKNSELATLSRLKTYLGPESCQVEDTEGEFLVYKDMNDLTLSDADRTTLAQFVTDTYLTDASMEAIRAKFEAESSIQLQNFLKPSIMESLQTAIQQVDETTVSAPTSSDYYQLGIGNGWSSVGPAHKQRFLEYKANANPEPVGQELDSIRAHLQSPVFVRFLARITGLENPVGRRGRVRRFRRGRDYTVAHYGLLTETSVLDATLSFVQISDDWSSGDTGGFECYIAADDEDDEAADEYRDDDDDTELLSVQASNNTLSLVYRDPGTMRFIKYVSAQAPSSRFDVAMEYQFAEEEDGDDDGGDDDEGETTKDPQAQ